MTTNTKTAGAIAAAILLLGAYAWFSRGDSSPSTPSRLPVTVTQEPSVRVPADWGTQDAKEGNPSFRYPVDLGTDYVTPQEWPPVVTLSAAAYACDVGVAAPPDRPSERAEREINGRTFCVERLAEGAAGSTYTTYSYATADGAGMLTVAFTLRTPQCENYDDPKKTDCKDDQSAFDVDALASAIAASAR